MKCPDCNAELTTVVVERFQTKTFKIDHEKRDITVLDSESKWEYNDHAYHCPECDSLNVNSILADYNVEGVSD